MKQVAPNRISQGNGLRLMIEDGRQDGHDC